MTDEDRDADRTDPGNLTVDGDTVLRYEPETGTYRGTYDPDATPPSLLVPLVVSALREAPPETLPALHYSVDPAALDRICTPDTGAKARFTYAGCRFSLDGAGVVCVADADD